MSTITTKDGTTIYYKDWGKGQPIIFSHGWPLTADAWDAQMLFLGQQGYRVIAHDRRGNGRSSQPWDGNDMDTYADDLSELFESLDLKDAAMVGHSTGGGEVARYIGRHGSKRVAKAVLIGAVTPFMLKTEKNPGGLPLSVFDGIRAALVADRSNFYQDLSLPFYGYNRRGSQNLQRRARQFLASGHDWIAQEPVRHHQSFFRDRPHRRPQEDRHPRSRPARRRRSDRPHRCCWPRLSEDPEERNPESYPGCSARHVHHPRRRNQCRPARIYQVVVTILGSGPSNKGLPRVNLIFTVSAYVPRYSGC